jgi:hypothetical protein
MKACGNIAPINIKSKASTFHLFMGLYSFIFYPVVLTPRTKQIKTNGSTSSESAGRVSSPFP